MKKLLYVALISIFSISLILVTSPAFAQTGEEVTEPAPPTVGDSANQTAPEVYAVNGVLMEELDKLVRALEEAENNDDEEITVTIKEKLRVIQEEITNPDGPMREIGEPQIIIQPGSKDERDPVVIMDVPTEVPTVNSVVEITHHPVDPCDEVKALEEKKRYYEELYALSDEALKAKGYSQGREEIKRTIENLENSIKKLRAECETGVPDSDGGGSGGTIPPTETVPIEGIPTRPIAVESGTEITDYYRLRIAEIAMEDVEIDKQIASLKELRDEIDKLIEELIKSRSEISPEEVSGLVEKIEVRPGEVRMDQVVVKTVDKSIVAKLDNKELSIKPTETQVIIHDEDLEVTAPEISIENQVIRIGASEVKLSPGAVIREIKLQPVEMELKEENDRAVYKIKADENRKLFGFIKIKVKKTLTVDASNTEVEILEEESPWWTFLTSK